MRQIYLDLDGVMFDFDSYFLELFGVPSSGLDDRILWQKITGYKNFFRELPLFPGALDFFESIRKHKPIILTACPKTDYREAAIQKREAVRRHICNDVHVLPVLGGKNKALFMHKPGDILIDDFVTNCDAWEDHGGHAILHKNFEETKIQLEYILEADDL